VGLKYGFSVKVLEVKAENGEPVLILAELLKEGAEKPKGYMHWVSVNESVSFEARIYDVLFTVHNPNELEDYLTGLNPLSLVVKPNGKMHKSLLACKHEDKV